MSAAAVFALAALQGANVYEGAQECAREFFAANPAQVDKWMPNNTFGGLFNSDYVGQVFGTDLIPDANMMDGPSGVRAVCLGHSMENRTAWPAAGVHGLAWSPELSFAVGSIGADDFRAIGSNVQLGPGVNVHRLPICGRNWEYVSGEDALLGIFGGELVKGIQSRNVTACTKHFALNSQELNRKGNVVEIDEETLMGTYLGAYVSQFDAGVGAVMCAYNLVHLDGSNTTAYLCSSEEVTNRLLRGVLGFGGAVMTDWVNHITSTTNGVTTEVRGLVDWEMTMGELEFDVPNNASLRTYLATNALAGMYASGAFPTQSCNASAKVQVEGLKTVSLPSEYQSAVDERSAEMLAAYLAVEGLVMLKNDNRTLPLHGPQVIFLTGEAILSGGGSGDSAAFGWEAPDHDGEGLNTGGLYAQEEMKRVLAASFGPGTEVYWDYEIPENVSEPTVILAFGAQYRTEGYPDPVDGYYNVDRCNSSLARANTVGGTYGTCNFPTFLESWRSSYPSATLVSVVTAGGPHLARNYIHAPEAALTTFYPGQAFALGLGLVLNGTISPGGRLSFTIPDLEVAPSGEMYVQSPISRFNPGLEYTGSDALLTLQIPAYYWNETTQEHDTTVVQYGEDTSVYAEAGLVGYKYFEKYGMRPHFAFGYGMTYYETSSVELETAACASPLTSGCDVSFNVSLVRSDIDVPHIGSEVVLLYVGYTSLTPAPQRPLRQLAGFLKVWESGVYKVSIPTSAFTSEWVPSSQTWTTPCAQDGTTGTFQVYLGDAVVASSHCTPSEEGHPVRPHAVLLGLLIFLIL